MSMTREQGTHVTVAVAAKPSAVAERVANDFASHEVDLARTARMESIRIVCRDAARMIVAHVPPGREQASALTKLEEAMFHANAGIVRSGQ